MTQPLDLDAARAARAEATEDTFEFILHGKQYSMPPIKDWDLRVMDALSQAQLDKAMSLLLGEDAYQSIQDSGSLSMADLQELFTHVAKWAGVDDLGNSSGSPTLTSTLT